MSSGCQLVVQPPAALSLLRYCEWLHSWGGIRAYTHQLPWSSWHLMTSSPMTLYMLIPNTGHWWGCRRSMNTCRTQQSLTTVKKDLKSPICKTICFQNNRFVLNRNRNALYCPLILLCYFIKTRLTLYASNQQVSRFSKGLSTQLFWNNCFGFTLHGDVFFWKKTTFSS